MERQQLSFRLPKPSKPLLALLVTLGCLWVLFAVSINWAHAGVGVFTWLAGNGEGVLHGQLWRLLTAALLHAPSSPMHAAVVILLLLFFAPPLETRWGSKRLFLFLAASAAFAFSIEVVMHRLMPSVASPVWFGGMVLADATAVAWAISARGQIVRLFFVLPVRPLVMVALLAVWHVLLLIARQPSPEGMFAPFGAMAAGYLFGDSSPLRRWYLQLKLRHLRAEVDTLRRKPSAARRRARSNLRVVDGGADDSRPDDQSRLN